MEFIDELPGRQRHAFAATGRSITDASPTDIAWAAGLFEGEGCLIRCSTTYGMRLLMNMTDLDVISKYADICGGHVTGPYEPTNRYGKKLMYRWTEARAAAVPLILSAFWPYLGSRRRAIAVE